MVKKIKPTVSGPEAEPQPKPDAVEAPQFRAEVVLMLLPLMKWDRRWAFKTLIRTRLYSVFDAFSGPDQLKQWDKAKDLHKAMRLALWEMQVEAARLSQDLNEALRQLTGGLATPQPAPHPDFDTVTQAEYDE